MVNKLRAILEPSGLHLRMEQYERLEAYHTLLLEWNQRMDLTNVPPDEMPLRHYADSLLPLLRQDLFLQGARLVDVGSGAGFPGLPLAIVRPDMEVVLLDSLKKRCLFLQTVVDTVGLANVRVLHGRAEDAARGELRAVFDLAVARAVAPLRVLAEYLLPFAKVGGKAVCWKGPAAGEELNQAQNALKLLGGRADVPWMLPLQDQEHMLLTIHKTIATPNIYPRKAGTPGKKPL